MTEKRRLRKFQLRRPAPIDNVSANSDFANLWNVAAAVTFYQLEHR